MAEYGAVKGWKNRIRIGLETANNESIWNGGRDPLANSLTLDTGVDIEKIHVVGKREPVSLVPGTQEITGSLERNLYSANASYNDFIYENDSLHHELLSVTGVYGGNISTCKILLNTTSSEASADYNRVIYAAKFHSYSTSVSSGETVTESVDYEATNLSTS